MLEGDGFNRYKKAADLYNNGYSNKIVTKANSDITNITTKPVGGSLSNKISLPGSINPFSHHLYSISRRVQVNPCISPVDLHNGVSVHTNKK